jgi:Ca2+-binding EF-hand superfamily protein
MASREHIVEMAIQIFDSYDEDNSGSLETKEFKKVIKEVFHEVNKNYPVDEKKLNQLFTIYDSNADGKISRK